MIKDGYGSINVVLNIDIVGYNSNQFTTADYMTDSGQQTLKIPLVTKQKDIFCFTHSSDEEKIPYYITDSNGVVLPVNINSSGFLNDAIKDYIVKTVSTNNFYSQEELSVTGDRADIKRNLMLTGVYFIVRQFISNDLLTDYNQDWLNVNNYYKHYNYNENVLINFSNFNKEELKEMLLDKAKDLKSASDCLILTTLHFIPKKFLLDKSIYYKELGLYIGNKINNKIEKKSLSNVYFDTLKINIYVNESLRDRYFYYVIDNNIINLKPIVYFNIPTEKVKITISSNNNKIDEIIDFENINKFNFYTSYLEAKASLNKSDDIKIQLEKYILESRLEEAKLASEIAQTYKSVELEKLKQEKDFIPLQKELKLAEIAGALNKLELSIQKARIDLENAEKNNTTMDLKYHLELLNLSKTLGSLIGVF